MLEINKVHCGDCLELMKELPDNSVDLVVTDPPYGLEFMGKKWDKAVPCEKTWGECLRILKPGGFAFVMSIPRADCQSRMVVNLEKAGFDVGFSPIFWAYASGFPKASNIGKMVDKRLGAEREVIGIDKNKGNIGYENEDYRYEDKKRLITTPSTPQAKALDGSYTYNPKPAVEVILVCQKPMSKKTYIDQALLYIAERQSILQGITTELKRKYNLDNVDWENE